MNGRCPAHASADYCDTRRQQLLVRADGRAQPEENGAHMRSQHVASPLISNDEKAKEGFREAERVYNRFDHYRDDIGLQPGRRHYQHTLHARGAQLIARTCKCTHSPRGAARGARRAQHVFCHRTVALRLHRLLTRVIRLWRGAPVPGSDRVRHGSDRGISCFGVRIRARRIHRGPCSRWGRGLAATACPNPSPSAVGAAARRGVGTRRRLCFW